MAVDIYSARELTRPFIQKFKPRTHLRNTYIGANGFITHNTRSFSIDKVTGSRIMAVFSSPVQKGVPYRHQGYTTTTVEPGYIKILDHLTPQDLQNRMPGEAIYGDHARPDERAARELSQHLRDIEDQIERREEYMVATGLTTGKVQIDTMNDAGEIVETREIDYGMEEAQTPTPTTDWDAEGATILQDLSDWCIAAAKRSGVFPTLATIGSDAVWSLLNDSTIQAYLDLRYANVAELRMELNRASGVTKLGVLRAPGCMLELETYVEWYKDPSTGTVTEVFPAEKVLLGNPATRQEMHYRAIEDFDIGEAFPELGGSNLAELRRFAKSWREKNPSAVNLLVQSGPLFVPVDLASLTCAKVVGND